EKLQKGLIADRANARYSSQQVNEGHAAPPIPGDAPKVAVAGAGAAPAAGAAAPAAAAGAPAAAPSTAGSAPAPAGAVPAPRRHSAAPVKGSEPAPQESSLTSPSIANLPQGEAPRVPPPAPGSAPARQQQQLAVVVPPPPVPPAHAVPVEPALQPSIMRAPGGKRPSVTLEAAEIAFAGDGKTLSGPDDQHLADVAKLQKQEGASLRVIGYAARNSGADSAKQDLASFGQALDRANTVAAALTKLGVPGEHITVQAAPALVGGGLPAGQVVVLLEY
ncbi:MAG TPA: OmpA family protein, partial [Stellaceae bacterium]|nr:OmpA family protein [Stellaceae bacterium]